MNMAISTAVANDSTSANKSPSNASTNGLSLSNISARKDSIKITADNELTIEITLINAPEKVSSGTAEATGATTVAADRSQVKEPQNESLSDWFILFCVFLSNVINGINFTGYGILYLSMMDQFNCGHAAVGWIQSLESAIASVFGTTYIHY